MGSWMKQVTRNEFLLEDVEVHVWFQQVWLLVWNWPCAKKDLENGNRGATVLSTDWKQTLGGECEHDSHMRWKNCLLATLDKILQDCWNISLDSGCLMFVFWNHTGLLSNHGAPPLGQVTPSRMSHDISWTPSETRKIDGNVHHQYKRILWIPWWTWKPTL